MYLTVILTGILLLLIYYVFKLWLKIKLRYGMAGVLLLLMPHSIGIVRSLDSETCIITLILSTAGLFILVADIAKQKDIVST